MIPIRRRLVGGNPITAGQIEMSERVVGESEGILLCPESAACIAAIPLLLEHHAIDANERIFVFNTASGLKYVDMMPSETPVVEVAWSEQNRA